MKRDYFFSLITVPILRVYPSSVDIHSYVLSFQTLLYLLLALLICFVLVCVFLIVWQYRQIKIKNRYLVQIILKLNDLKFLNPVKFDDVLFNTQTHDESCSTLESDKVTPEFNNDEELFSRIDEQRHSKN